MSATMARQGGRVQLEQSDMRLALNMGKMAKEGLSRAAIEETKYLKKKPLAEVRKEMKRGVEYPGHKKVKAAIRRHPAMLLLNKTSSSLSCNNVTAMILQTHWTREGTGPPPPARRKEQIPEPTAPQPGTPPAPTGITSGDQPAKIINLPAGFTYSHPAFPCAEQFEVDQDTEHNSGFDPDTLTDEG